MSNTAKERKECLCSFPREGGGCQGVQSLVCVLSSQLLSVDGVSVYRGSKGMGTEFSIQTAQWS